ncbi:hypothetical protein CHUAL_012137 [Chamberlinius hualienensis]
MDLKIFYTVLFGLLIGCCYCENSSEDQTKRLTKRTSTKSMRNSGYGQMYPSFPLPIIKVVKSILKNKGNKKVFYLPTGYLSLPPTNYNYKIKNYAQSNGQSQYSNGQSGNGNGGQVFNENYSGQNGNSNGEYNVDYNSEVSNGENENYNGQSDDNNDSEYENGNYNDQNENGEDGSYNTDNDNYSNEPDEDNGNYENDDQQQNYENGGDHQSYKENSGSHGIVNNYDNNKNPIANDLRTNKNYDTLFRGFVVDYFRRKYKLKTEMPYN